MELSEYQQLMNTADRNLEPSFEDRLRATRDTVVSSIKDSIAVNDEYGNSLLAIGSDNKTDNFSTYDLSNDSLNWALWVALYNDSWVFRRAIDKPAQDMIRSGINIQNIHNYAESQKVYQILKKHRDDFIQLLQWGALFGGSIACLMFDNMTDEDYKLPMDEMKLKSSKVMRMYVVDRWYGVTPSYSNTVTNMSNIDFGKPKYYTVTLADGKSITFHHDFVLRYEHRFAPKFVKNGMLQGWGYAEGSHILNELSRDEKLKGSIQTLIDKSLIEVIKMSGMRGIFMGADKQNEEQLRKRLEMVNWGRNFNSLTFLDKDDDYQQNQFSGLTGLSDLLEKNMWMISAALEMQGVLFGDLKQGFSNDVDALERYDETINGRCESYLRPVYEKFLSIMYKKFGINEKVEFTFNSLMMKKQDSDRVDAIKKFTELLSQLISDGILDAKLAATTLQKYINDGTIDFGLTEEVVNKMQENFDEQLEGINL